MAEPRRPNLSLAVFVALLFALLAFSLRIAAPFLLAVFIGELLALIFAPLYRRMSRALPQGVAAMLLTLAVLVVLAGPAALIGVLAARQAQSLADALSGRQVFSLEHLETLLRPLARVVGGPAQLAQRLASVLESGARILSGAALRLVALLPRAVLQFFVALAAFYYLLRDGDRFLDFSCRLLPVEDDVRVELIETFKATTVSTVWASLAGACLHAVVMTISFLIFGIPMVALAAATAFVLAWVPIVGSAPVALAGGAYLLYHGHYLEVAFGFAIGYATAFSDDLLRSLILRGRARMHTLLALVAILGGVYFWGLTGVFVGPVLAAMLLALIDLWPTVAARHGLPLSGLPAHRK